MATVMLSFLAGLFVGEEDYEGIKDILYAVNSGTFSNVWNL
jgi:hypothetical protein